MNPRPIFLLVALASLSVILMALASEASASDEVTLIPKGSIWKYHDQGADLNTAWKEPAYDDSLWASGAAELGYGDDPATTLREGPDGQVSVTKYITCYFRRHFTVADTNSVTGLHMNLQRDDGAVIYINGTEVARSNMSIGTVTYTTQAFDSVAGTDESTYFPITLPPASLVTGDNVIAVSIHQYHPLSPDVSFDLELIDAFGNSSGTVARGPYLNMPNQNSIVVRWRSSQSVVGRVRYGLTPENLDQFTDESSPQTDHVVRLTGLTPYTRYYYSVGSPADTLTPQAAETTSYLPGAPAPLATDYTFRTSPLPGTAVDTRVWIIGDCGRGSQTQADARNAYSTFTGSRIPDLNLQMGDNAYESGTDAEYQTGYFNIYQNSFRKMPQWSTLGNHDASDDDTNPNSNHPYFDMFTFPAAGECGGVASGTEHYYSFDYGNIHFICLDSQASVKTVDNPATPNTNEDGPMATWLRQDLASTTATWIIAFWHHAPYSKGSADSDNASEAIEMRSDFNPILENGGVDLVFCGHSHNYERSVLLDGHYSNSGNLTTAMKKNSGNGSSSGFTTSNGGKIRNAANGFTATATVNGAVIPPDGVYKKPLTGPRDHFGAVYNTAGMSGSTDSSPIDHPAMYISYNQVGTVNLDINGNTLTSTFIQADGSKPDNFTIVKQGAADTDGDGISDEYEIANGLDRYSDDALGSGGDSDGLSNLLEFAFGLNPNVNDSAAAQVNVPGLALNQRGTPTLYYPSNPSGTDFEAVFIRRTKATEEGLRYIVQVSGDLVNWVDNAVVPTVIATSGEVEAVSVHYPLFAAGKETRFFRVHVTSGNY